MGVALLVLSLPHGYDSRRPSSQKEPVLNSRYHQKQLKQSTYWSDSPDLNEYLAARGLDKLPHWVRLCPESCWQYGGTCNLLAGSCACPPGRVSDAEGVLASPWHEE